MAKDENFCPLELKIPKMRSNSAPIFSKLAYVGVRTLGSGVELFTWCFYFKVCFFVLSYICEEVVHLRTTLSSRSWFSVKASKCSDCSHKDSGSMGSRNDIRICERFVQGGNRNDPRIFGTGSVFLGWGTISLTPISVTMVATWSTRFNFVI